MLRVVDLQQSQCRGHFKVDQPLCLQAKSLKNGVPSSVERQRFSCRDGAVQTGLAQLQWHGPPHL
jgi:hypothetical protein